MQQTKLLDPAWNPKSAADQVLKGLVRITGPEVLGAHEAEFVCVGDHAFIVTTANDERPGEHPAWPFCYVTMRIRSLLSKLLLLPAALFAFATGAHGANQTWTNNGSVSGNWSETTNWGGNAAPGATSGSASTDVATFISSSGTYGTSANPILIDSGRNISGLTFNGSVDNYTIGTTGGNALHITSGGTILIGNGLTSNNTTVTVNAPLLMYGGVTINNQAPNRSNKFVIRGNISAASGSRTLTLQSVSASSTNVNEITGQISNGNGTVSVSQSSGGGIWTLSNSTNSFTGNLSVGGGSLTVTSIGNRSSASAAGSGTTINIGASTSTANLIYAGTGNTTNRTINMAGTTGGARIFANNASGLLKFTSNFTATGTGSKLLTLQGNGTGEISGAIVDNGTTGSTVTTATANLTTSLVLASVDGLTAGNAISGTGIPTGTTINAINNGNKTVTLSNATTSVSSGAVITSAGLANRTSLTKNDAGTWTLSGSNTHTGPTTINAGRLVLAGTLASEIVASGGTLAPNGASATTGNISIGSSSHFEVRVNGPVAGTQYDQLSAGGTVSLGGSLDIVPAPGLPPGTSFVILNKTSLGAISGTFARKPNGCTFTSGGYAWQINYNGGDGNDVVLSTVPALQSWRHNYFGTIANIGNAADTYDSNGDGELNLLEFATGQNPNARGMAGTTIFSNNFGTNFTYTRSNAALASGLSFAVEWSDTLGQGSWSTLGANSEIVLSDNGSTQQVRVTAPASGVAKRFFRLKASHSDAATNPPAFWQSLKDGKPQKLVIYGTSLTIREWVGGSGEWVLELRNWAKDKPLEIINSAEGGKNSQWGLENLQNRVLQHDPDYVIIEFGMNDAYAPYNCTLEQVKEQLEAMIFLIRQQNPDVGICLMSMNPALDAMHNMLPDFYNLYRDAAIFQGLDYIDHYATWMEMETLEPGFLETHIPDDVHPDGESVKMITWPNLENFLNSKLQ